MVTLIIGIDDDSIDTDQGIPEILATLRDPPHSPDNNHMDPADFREMLAALPDGALEIHRSTYHPDWDHGKPCPECGNETLSVMSLDEDIYKSIDGEFEFIKLGDGLGPTLSILCPDCMTYLAHVPYQHLTV